MIEALTVTNLDLGPMTIRELAARVCVSAETIRNHIKNQVYRLDLALKPRSKGEKFIMFQGLKLEVYIKYMDAINRGKQIKSCNQ